VRYNAEVIAYFKATGDGWQTRMNDALRERVVARQAVLARAFAARKMGNGRVDQKTESRAFLPIKKACSPLKTCATSY
jgi:hypothetical protein